MPGALVLSPELERLMTLYGLEYDQLALALDTDKRTVLRWLAGETFPQHASRVAIERLVALGDRLDATFSTTESARGWLWGESGYFGGLRPIDALLRGRIDAVDAALEAIDSGIFV